MTTPPQDPFASARPPHWDAPPAQGYGPPPGYGPVPYGAPPQPYGAQPYGPGYAGPQQTSTQAIIVLCLAIGSFVVFPLIPAIVALALASGAREEIEASGGRLGGEGMVTAGKVVAWINIGLCIAGVLAVVAAFGLLATTGFS